MNNFLYILFFIIGMFVLMQVWVRLSTYLKKGKKVENIGGNLGKEIGKGGKHVVYFYSNSCGACKPMSPVIDALKKEFNNIHKVNLSTDMEAARKFGVMGTPSLVVLENQLITSFLVGAKTENFIRKLL